MMDDVKWLKYQSPKSDMFSMSDRIISKLRHSPPTFIFRYKAEKIYPIFSHPIDVNKWWISQKFGENPKSYYPLKGHDGLDYACNVGTSIMCPVERMTIIDIVIQTGSYGRHVWGVDNYGHKHIFGHLHACIASKGDIVTRGQIFATSGGNLDDPYHGYSTGPHLHWEWRPIWASIYNGYGGAEDQLPYVIYGDVTPTPIPITEPLFYMINQTEGLTVRTSPKIPALNNNKTGEKLSKGARIPIYSGCPEKLDYLEGRVWGKISDKSEKYACIQENGTSHMILENNK